jgi:hypothetical protein
MMLCYEVDQVVWESGGQVWITICDMRDEVDQIADRNYAVIWSSCRRTLDEVAIGLILLVLGLEVELIRERVSADLVLKIGTSDVLMEPLNGVNHLTGQHLPSPELLASS